MYGPVKEVRMGSVFFSPGHPLVTISDYFGTTTLFFISKRSKRKLYNEYQVKHGTFIVGVSALKVKLCPTSTETGWERCEKRIKIHITGELWGESLQFGWQQCYYMICAHFDSVLKMCFSWGQWQAMSSCCSQRRILWSKSGTKPSRTLSTGWWVSEHTQWHFHSTPSL